MLIKENSPLYDYCKAKGDEYLESVKELLCLTPDYVEYENMLFQCCIYSKTGKLFACGLLNPEENEAIQESIFESEDLLDALQQFIDWFSAQDSPQIPVH